jgi:arylsulfatase A-like enzyme
LNAEEEPENPNYPKDPNFKKKFGPRGVIHSFADGKIEDTGPLTQKRMETIDEEVIAKTLDFMERAKKADKPFFIWWNSTRMHIFTHLKPESQGKTGLGTYADGMVEHDGHVGQLLAKLKELGLEDNTIVRRSSSFWAMKVAERSAPPSRKYSARPMSSSTSARSMNWIPAGCVFWIDLDGGRISF